MGHRVSQRSKGYAFPSDPAHPEIKLDLTMLSSAQGTCSFPLDSENSPSAGHFRTVSEEAEEILLPTVLYLIPTQHAINHSPMLLQAVRPMYDV